MPNEQAQSWRTLRELSEGGTSSLRVHKGLGRDRFWFGAQSIMPPSDRKGAGP